MPLLDRNGELIEDNRAGAVEDTVARPSNDADLSQLKSISEKLSLIVLNFPSFADGRASGESAERTA